MLVDAPFLGKNLDEMIHAYTCVDASPPAIVCSAGVRKIIRDSVHVRPAFAGDSMTRPTLYSDEYKGIPIVVLAGAVGGTLFVTSLKQAKELVSTFTIQRKLHALAQELGL